MESECAFFPRFLSDFYKVVATLLESCKSVVLKVWTLNQWYEHHLGMLTEQVLESKLSCTELETDGSKARSSDDAVAG